MSFEKYLEKKLSNVEKVLINTLEYVGQQAVNEARDNGSYQDQTGNLRSSIGYIIVKDGEVLHRKGFDTVKEGGSGSTAGRTFANKVASETQGLALIVVAGMNYASYVETSRNVLTSSEILAERTVPKMLKELGLSK